MKRARAFVVAWHRDMGRRLRAMDPCRHLISSSFTGGSERPDLFALPEMDFSQYHSYNELHPAPMMARMSGRFFEKYRKPFFVSEYGTDWKGWKPDSDPHFPGYGFPPSTGVSSPGIGLSRSRADPPPQAGH